MKFVSVICYRLRIYKKYMKQKERTLKLFVGVQKICANPESNRGPNDGNVGFYH